jgi:GT2 family glycosyltransferase
MTEVIIIKYGLPEYERECVESVVANTSIPYNLTVHDNYPKDENLSVVWNNRIRSADSRYVCLLNNDTVVNKDWLKKLVSTFDDYENVGAVGAITNHCGTHQSGFSAALEDGKVEPCNTLSGFCMVIDKEAWEKVGGFDEDYHLYGEDSDFCNRLKKAGYNMFTRYDVWIYHYKAKSTEVAEKRGKDIQKIRRNASQMFKKKWS